LVKKIQRVEQALNIAPVGHRFYITGNKTGVLLPGGHRFSYRQLR